MAINSLFADIDVLLASLNDRATGALERIGSWVSAHPQLAALFLVLAIIPTIFWLWLFIRRGHMDPVHRRFMILTFIFGMGSVPLVFAFDMILEQLFHLNIHGLFDRTPGRATLSNFLYYVVAVGMLEEYAKHVVVKEIDYRRRFFNRIVDGIEFSIAAALGFAFVENILYFSMAWNAVTAMQFVGVVLVRSFGSMLAHVLFSAIFGYYYGRAKFFDDTPATGRVRQHIQLPFLGALRLRAERIWHVFQGSHVFVEVGHLIRRDEIIAEGLLFSMVLHGLYDFFLDINLVFLIVPLLFLEYLFIWHELDVTENLQVHAAKARK